MYRRMLRASLAVLLAMMVAPDSQAQTSIQLRPIEDFLEEQQGTFPPGCTFVPPVPNYVGWINHDFVWFALVDYAGLANEFIETESGGTISLGTLTSGIVIKHAQPDGRSEVNVFLRTKNALAWTFAIADANFDVDDPFCGEDSIFLSTPLTFGARAQDVLNGAEPTLGDSNLHVRFMNSAPGAPLPDLVQLLNAPDPEQVPLRISFNAVAIGMLPDGTPAILRVEQIGSAEFDESIGEIVWSWSTEIVKIRPLEDGE